MHNVNNPNAIWTPSLVLFGSDKRQIEVSTLIKQVNLDAPISDNRPCVSWSSTHAGVDFLSSLCANTIETFCHRLVSENRLISNRATGAMLDQPGMGDDTNLLYAYSIVVLQSKTSLATLALLGRLTFTSELVVNDKHALYQNTSTGLITEENRNQLVQDVVIAQEQTGANITFSRDHDVPKQTGTNITVFDDLDRSQTFGFIWDDFQSFRDGLGVLVFATLAQATREPIKAAAVMSLFNLRNTS